MTYNDKLKDPRWQRKRLEIFHRDNFTCVICKDESTSLCVHHIAYLPNVEPWDQPIYLMVTECEDCHSSELYYPPEVKISRLKNIMLRIILEELEKSTTEIYDKKLSLKLDSVISALGK